MAEINRFFWKTTRKEGEPLPPPASAPRPLKTSELPNLVNKDILYKGKEGTLVRVLARDLVEIKSKSTGGTITVDPKDLMVK